MYYNLVKDFSRSSLYRKQDIGYYKARVSNTEDSSLLSIRHCFQYTQACSAVEYKILKGILYVTVLLLVGIYTHYSIQSLLLEHL